MANEQNLTHKLTVNEQRKGGQKSAQVRREKKTVQKILNDFLSTAAKDNPQVSKLAAKMGLQDDGSIKDLFTIVCTLNTLKKGDLSDLERLTALLGEQTETAKAEKKQEDDPLTKSLREYAMEMEADADK